MDFENVVGKTIDSIEGMEEDSEEILFILDGKKYKMFHVQDCCESVRVAEVIGGKSEDLVGQKILDAYESSEDASNDVENGVLESGTWTFYTIRTMDTSVTIRWLGESNGYYSEYVSFECCS